MASRLTRGLAATDRYLAKFEEGVLFALLMTLLFLAVLQVIQRNITDSAPMWADIMLRHLTFAVGLLGASLATHADKQIHIDLMSRLLPERPRLISRLVVGFATIIVCGIFLNAGWKQYTMELEFPSPLFFGVTSAHSFLLVPVTFGLIALHLILRWFFDLGVLLTRRQTSDHA